MIERLSASVIHHWVEQMNKFKCVNKQAKGSGQDVWLFVVEVARCPTSTTNNYTFEITSAAGVQIVVPKVKAGAAERAL